MSKGIDPHNFDTSVKPAENFYQYVNGGWLKANPIPADEYSWGSFNEVHKKNIDRLKVILEEIAEGEHESGSNKQKLKDMFVTGMDMTARNEQRMHPLAPLFEMIASIDSQAELLFVLARLHRAGVNAGWFPYVEPDSKQNELYSFNLSQGGIGLPDCDYYFKDDDKSKQIREAYQTCIQRMFELLGVTDERAVATIIDFETKLAEMSWNSEALRDYEKLYNKVELADLVALAPNLDWEAYRQELGVREFDYVIVPQPEFISRVAELFTMTSLDDWKLYLRWRVISEYAPFLSDDFVTAHFDFYGRALTGAQELQPLWRRVLKVVDLSLGEALGQEFVVRHFPPAAKERMMEMIDFLIEAFAARIEQLSWMSAETKQKAIEKLHATTRQIGYPDKWRDYSLLTITTDSFASNVLASREFEFKRVINRLGQPVDKYEWFMSPPTVNAYNWFNYNQIVFPAGILQPPFFDMEADDAVNYGDIGAVIGHELTHGFDDQGSKYDATGNMANWWTQEDRQKFDALAEKVVEQFNEFEALPGYMVNGKLTLGENIADLGGLYIAFDALQRSFEKNGRPDLIDDLTPEQRFFISYAQGWRQNIKDEALHQRVMTDPHSPTNFRVLGPLSNIPAFHAAFGAEPGDALYRDPDQRIVIW